MTDRTTTHAQRIEMVHRHQQGQSYHQIAHALGLNYYTVRKWCRRYRRHNWPGIEPRSPAHRRPGTLSHFHPLVKYVTLKLKRQHPGWGLDKLRLELQRRPALGGQRLPARSTLHSYLRQFYPRLREHRPARTQRPAAPVARAKGPHQCWQMDFKGEYPFATLGKVNPFMVCDEYTSAPLAGILHAGKRGGVTLRDVQRNLRQVFAQWGLPDCLRMDRDPIWVGSSRLEFPSVLLLWLVGLGIIPIINRPHRPTDNAQVERCNGIWVEQVARGAAPNTWTELQHQTDVAWRDRREYLPSRNPACAGQPPAIAVPALWQVRRPYHPQQEARLLDMQRVHTYLAQWRWQRLVDKTGQFSLGGYQQHVPRPFVGHLLTLHFDPHAGEFIAATIDGRILRRFLLPILQPATLMGTGSLPLDTS
jgi:transposase